MKKGEVCVRFHKGTDILAVATEVGLRIKDCHPSYGLALLEVPEGEEDVWIGRLRLRNDVQSAERVYLYRLL